MARRGGRLGFERIYTVKPTLSSYWSDSKLTVQDTWLIKAVISTLADLGGGGAPGTWVQILSFSCSFRRKNCKIISIWELAHPRRENPGSATDLASLHCRDVTYWSQSVFPLLLDRAY